LGAGQHGCETIPGEKKKGQVPVDHTILGGTRRDIQRARRAQLSKIVGATTVSQRVRGDLAKEGELSNRGYRSEVSKTGLFRGKKRADWCYLFERGSSEVPRSGRRLTVGQFWGSGGGKRTVWGEVIAWKVKDQGLNSSSCYVYLYERGPPTDE